MNIEEKLSIIMPAYNCDKYLEKCVNSVLDQDYINFELIIINDGSTDTTADICENLKQKDSRIKVIHSENKGPSAARNIGLKYAKGKFLTFIDSDDELNRSAYSRMIKEIKKQNVDILVGQWNIIDENRKSKKSNITPVGKFDNQEVIKSIINDDLKFGGGFPWNKMIDWEKVKKNAGRTIYFNEELFIYEDKCWILEILKYCKKVFVSDIYSYNYYIRKNSLSHSYENNQKRIQMIQKSYYYMKKFLKEPQYIIEIEKGLEMNQLNLIWYRYKGKLIHNDKCWERYILEKKYSVKEYSQVMKIKFYILKIYFKIKR